MQYSYTSGLYLGLRIMEIFRAADRFSDIQSIAYLILYPTVFDQIAPLVEEGSGVASPDLGLRLPRPASQGVAEVTRTLTAFRSRVQAYDGAKLQGLLQAGLANAPLVLQTTRLLMDVPEITLTESSSEAAASELISLISPHVKSCISVTIIRIYLSALIRLGHFDRYFAVTGECLQVR